MELWTNGSPAFVPTSVTVPAGSAVATFPVTTMWTPVSQPDTITAFHQGEIKTTTVIVQPALAIAAVTAPATVTGGATVSGNVTLNMPAPPGGIVVSLWTSGFPAFVPLSVTIGAGTMSSNFPIATIATSQPEQPVITAFYNGGSTTTMNVLPMVGLASVSVIPNAIAAGNSATGTVTLNGVAPAGGLVVELWTNGFPVFVPTNVTVPAGASTVTFPVTAVYTTTAAQNTITAFYSGVEKTTTVSIAPATALASISAPAAIIGGSSASGTVSLSAPAPPGGVVVSLWTSGFPAFVPTSVIIAAGTTTTSFTITTVPTSQAFQPVITAFYAGAIKTATVVVTPTISHQATLNWNASTTPAVTYNVYRRAQSAGPYSKINSAAVDATSYVDTAVAGGQTYYYVVTAVSSGGLESNYSNEAAAVIPSD